MNSHLTVDTLNSPGALTPSNSVFIGNVHKSRCMLTHWHSWLCFCLSITFITTFIIIYMTICVGLYNAAPGQQGLALKGSSACWDCGLLRSWHSGRRCPAGRASGDAVWLIGLSWPAHKAFCPWANSSCPAWKDGEGWRCRGCTMEFFFFQDGEPPSLFFYTPVFALQCSARWR